MSVALTRSRLSNAFRCYVGYALNRLGSALFRSPVSRSPVSRSPFAFRHSPLFVSVEPANICQLRCPACPVGRRDTGIPGFRDTERFMSLDLWHRVLSEIRGTALVVQFYFQGEPLLNKNLPSMIREAHDAGLYTIVSTNAQAMTLELAQALVQAGLDRIIVSMDGLTEESYGSYRIGGSLEKTKQALRWLREAKGRMVIELQCLRLRTNEHEWEEMKMQYKSLGADKLTLKTAQLYDYADGHPLMPSEEKYSRYIKGKDGKYHRRKLSKGCWRVWSGCVITTSGEVLPCCYDKGHAFSYGNIMEASLKDLFRSEKAQAFRKAAYQQTPNICQECYK